MTQHCRARSPGRYAAVLGGLFFFTMLPGCGGTGTKPDQCTVSGTVTFNGDPVTGGILVFHITTAKNENVSATTLIKGDGTYAVSEVTAGAAKVSVDNPAAPRKAGDVAIPKKFADPKTSGLKYDIGTGTQTIDIDLK